MACPGYATATRATYSTATATKHGRDMSRDELAALVESVRPYMRKLVRDMRPNLRAEDVADLVQDCLLAAWKAAPRFDPSLSRASTFFGKVARGVIANQFRDVDPRRVNTVTLDRP